VLHAFDHPASLSIMITVGCEEAHQHLIEHHLIEHLDTFDCVQPTRVARTGRVYTSTGRRNLTVATARREFNPIEDDCDCPTCANHSVAYLHHLLRTKEYLGATLVSLHNLRFYVRLVAQMREALISGEFDAFRTEFLGRYLG